MCWAWPLPHKLNHLTVEGCTVTHFHHAYRLIVGNFPLILNTNPKEKEQVVCSYDHTVGMKPYAAFQLPRFLIMFFMFHDNDGVVAYGFFLIPE